MIYYYYLFYIDITSVLISSDECRLKQMKSQRGVKELLYDTFATRDY